MRSIRLFTILLTSTVLLVSCGDTDPQNQPPDQLHFLRLKDPGAGSMDAELKGTLIVTEGCFQIQDEFGAYTTIWPNRYDYRQEASDIEILGYEGQVVAKVGEPILVGGGSIPSLTREEFEELVIGSTECPEPYWLVGNVAETP